jgi:hypothetical protein
MIYDIYIDTSTNTLLADTDIRFKINAFKYYEIIDSNGLGNDLGSKRNNDSYKPLLCNRRWLYPDKDCKDLFKLVYKSNGKRPSNRTLNRLRKDKGSPKIFKKGVYWTYTNKMGNKIVTDNKGEVVAILKGV